MVPISSLYKTWRLLYRCIHGHGVCFIVSYEHTAHLSLHIEMVHILSLHIIMKMVHISLYAYIIISYGHDAYF